MLDRIVLLISKTSRFTAKIIIAVPTGMVILRSVLRCLNTKLQDYFRMAFKCVKCLKLVIHLYTFAQRTSNYKGASTTKWHLSNILSTVLQIMHIVHN